MNLSSRLLRTLAVLFCTWLAVGAIAGTLQQFSETAVLTDTLFGNDTDLPALDLKTFGVDASRNLLTAATTDTTSTSTSTTSATQFKSVAPGGSTSIQPIGPISGGGGSNTIQPLPTPVSGGGGGTTPQAAGTNTNPGWTGGGGDDFWSTSANWQNGANPDGNSNQAVVIEFQGTTRLTPNNNYGAYTQFQQILFDPGAGAFTLNGNAIKLFNWGGTAKIENNSTTLQTVSFNSSGVGIDFVGNGEIDPTNGDLVINSGVITDGGGTATISIFGNSGRTVTFNGIIANGGATTALSLNANVTAVLANTNTYSGDTSVNAGILQFGTSASSVGSANNSVIRLGATTGTGVNASINLATLAGGQTISSTINPRTGASGTYTLSLNSQNTSNTNTYSGHIGMDKGFLITQAAGGKLDITQARSGVSTTTGLDIKQFTLTLNGAGATSVINISGDIYSSNNSINGQVTVGSSSATALTAVLSGNNTYAGGTILNTNSVLNINSATALGTGALSINGTSTIDNTSAAAITLTNANALSIQGANLTFTGTKDLSFGANTTTIGGTTGTRQLTTTAGTLTVGSIVNGGTIPSTFAKAGAGTLTVIGNSTYTAATTIAGTLKVDNNGTSTNGQLSATTGITISATNSGTLLLSGSSTITDRINNVATMTLSGGTFNTGGLSERGGTAGAPTAGIGALTLTANSTIDFGAGSASVIEFAGVGTHPSGTGPDLAITNWNGVPVTGGSGDRLLFAGSTIDFTSQYAQSDVSFNGKTGYVATQFSGFYEITEIPEPSTWLGAGLTLGAIGFSQRRRLSKLVKRSA